MTTPQIHWLDSVWSTNTELVSLELGYPHGTVFSAHEQTAGRGQRGNKWEAEPRKNLTFSVLLRPRTIAPAESFVVSMLTSLSIVEALESFMPETEIKIKWPNDIYVADKKLCGILIENSFSGGLIDYSVVGIGINVNQTEFLSDAPNPVSMAGITGSVFDLQSVLEEVCQQILDDFDEYEAYPDVDKLMKKYRARQWRGTGLYKWLDVATGETLTAAIDSISADGYLTLNTMPKRSYAFKEIVAIL